MDIEPSVKKIQEKKLLRDIRKELGLSQQQLAVYLDWERAELSRLETGARIPDWITRAIKLDKLLKQAGYSLSDIEPTQSSDK